MSKKNPSADSTADKPKSSALSGLFGGVLHAAEDDDSLDVDETTADLEIYTSRSYDWVVSMMTYFIGIHPLIPLLINKSNSECGCVVWCDVVWFYCNLQLGEVWALLQVESSSGDGSVNPSTDSLDDDVVAGRIRSRSVDSVDSRRKIAPSYSRVDLCEVTSTKP